MSGNGGGSGDTSTVASRSWKAKETNKLERNVNTIATDGGDRGIDASKFEAGVEKDRMLALQALFDTRVKEIQQSRLQPGRQTTMITGRQ